MRKIAILCLLLVGALPALAGSYRPDEIPNVQRMDRRRYVSNPDGILSAGAVARIDSLCASLRERGLAQVAVSAGKIGYQVVCDPKDLMALLRAGTADIIVE